MKGYGTSPLQSLFKDMDTYCELKGTSVISGIDWEDFNKNRFFIQIYGIAKDISGVWMK